MIAVRSRRFRVWVTAVALLAAQGGCYRLVREERLQRIEIRTDPPGLLVSTQDDEQGVRHRGPAPVVIEQRQDVSIKRFRHWHWVWPGIASVGAAVGLAMNQSDRYESQGAAVASLSILALVITTITNIVGVVDSGKVASASPDTLLVRVQAPGGEARPHRVPFPAGTRPDGRLWSSTIRVEPGQGMSPAERPAFAPLRRGALLAVFAVKDQTGGLPEESLARLDAHLRAGLAARDLRLVSPEQLEAALPRALEDRRRCYPGTCQLEVGRSVGAELGLSTRIQRAGATCALTAIVVELHDEVIERRASVSAGCAPAALLGAADELAAQLGQPRVSITVPSTRPAP